MTWPGPHVAPGRDDVAGAASPSGSMPRGSASRSISALGGELRLVGAEAPERPAHRVVGAHGHGLDVDGRPHVRAAGVARPPAPAPSCPPRRRARSRRRCGPCSAVSLPSASQPAHASMRTGWRLAWMSSDSSRLSVHFTGRRSSQAARAVWAWLAQSSLPPKAPPLATRWTSDPVLGRCRARRRSGGGRPTRPGRRRTPPAGRRRAGTASVDSGSRKACSTRWVWNTSCTTCGRWRRGRLASDVAPRAYGRCATATLRVECPTPPASGVPRAATRRRSNGAQRAVVDRAPARPRAAGRGPVLGHHQGEHVARVRGAPAHGDEHGPVAGG